MKQYVLSDVLEIISGGTPKTSVAEYWNGVIPWLSVKDFNNNQRYVYKTEKTITEAGLKNSATTLLRKGDIILSARGTVGEMATIPFPMAFNQSCYGLRAKHEFITDDFLYYLLKCNISSFKKISHGSVFDTITKDTFNNITVCLPELDTQKKIASMLSALDSKIEQNTAINNNLEQQAQALFKSWFIDFEPFGGTMPDDWEERALTDIPYFTLLKPGISSFDGEKYYVATADADEDGITNKTTFVTMQNKPSRANMQPLVDSVWFAKMKNSRKNILINELWAEEIHKFILSTGFYGFACQPNTLYFLWCFVASDAFDEMKNNLCNGTTMEAINNDGLGQITLTVPPLEIIQKFNDTVSAMFKQISQNKFENEHLAAVRDVLLPKLMSGEIDVSKVDISDPGCLDKSLFIVVLDKFEKMVFILYNSKKRNSYVQNIKIRLCFRNKMSECVMVQEVPQRVTAGNEPGSAGSWNRNRNACSEQIPWWGRHQCYAMGL